MDKAKQIFWFVVLVVLRTPKSAWEHWQAEYERILDNWDEAEDFRWR